MVLKKKLDSGYNGFLVPTIPRCPRSKRNPRRQNIRDDQVCAFELLASLAGKLLQESESSASSNSQEGNYQAVIGNDGVKEEHLQADKTVNSSGILFTVLAKNAESDACTKIEACSTDLGEATDNNVQSAIEKRLDESSGSDIKLSLQSRKDVKLGSRDDDGKFSKCCKSSTKLNSYKPPSGFGRRRMRNFVKSEYWKVAPRSRDFETSRSDGGWKSFYCKRKTCYNRAKYHRETLCKKRRCFDQNSVVTSDGGMSSESVSNSPEKSLNADKGSLNPNAPHASISTKDSHVKFNIKSLKVPELSIEVPDKATIGSLKKLIMEALITILEGGLSVGVHIHGKKVRDDNRTLFQTGLSCKDNLDTVDFTLEPDPVQASPPTCYANPPLLLCNTIPLLPGSASEALLADIPLIDSRNLGESNHQESSSSHTDIILTDKSSTDCKALVIVSENSVQALAVVPLNQKGKRSEHVQRRIRRPFSVSEVEALVKAVEDLGTGRWRDVKLRAFENADHRTYVDLKDKWKTLVHTARISPQQRRGEPVPQELLDRVMSAHSYWSDQHQAKQHGSKHQSKTDLKLIEGPAPQQGFVIW